MGPTTNCRRDHCILWVGDGDSLSGDSAAAFESGRGIGTRGFSSIHASMALWGEYDLFQLREWRAKCGLQTQFPSHSESLVAADPL